MKYDKDLPDIDFDKEIPDLNLDDFKVSQEDYPVERVHESTPASKLEQDLEDMRERIEAQGIPFEKYVARVRHATRLAREYGFKRFTIKIRNIPKELTIYSEFPD